MCVMIYDNNKHIFLHFQLYTTLEEDEFARNHRLAFKLEQVSRQMSSEV